MTGMFYANRSIYYTLAGNKNLFSRAFSPDTTASSVANQVTGGVISPQKITVAPASGRSTSPTPAACSSPNGYLWYATKADGELHKVAWNGTTVHRAEQRRHARRRATGPARPCSSHRSPRR